MNNNENFKRAIAESEAWEKKAEAGVPMLPVFAEFLERQSPLICGPPQEDHPNLVTKYIYGMKSDGTNIERQITDNGNCLLETFMTTMPKTMDMMHREDKSQKKEFATHFRKELLDAYERFGGGIQPGEINGERIGVMRTTQAYFGPEAIKTFCLLKDKHVCRFALREKEVDVNFFYNKRCTDPRQIIFIVVKGSWGGGRYHENHYVPLKQTDFPSQTIIDTFMDVQFGGFIEGSEKSVYTSNNAATAFKISRDLKKLRPLGSPNLQDVLELSVNLNDFEKELEKHKLKGLTLPSLTLPSLTLPSLTLPGLPSPHKIVHSPGWKPKPPGPPPGWKPSSPTRKIPSPKAPSPNKPIPKVPSPKAFRQPPGPPPGWKPPSPTRKIPSPTRKIPSPKAPSPKQTRKLRSLENAMAAAKPKAEKKPSPNKPSPKKPSPKVAKQSLEGMMAAKARENAYLAIGAPAGLTREEFNRNYS